MDVVVYAGPVIIKPAFKQIPWKRPTVIIPIPGAGSSSFSRLADQLRGSDGRILPNLIERYVRPKVPVIDKLALCSYSAGYGLLNKVFRVDADRAEVDACVLSDSAFSSKLDGMSKMAADAMTGRKLMVIANTDNMANIALGIRYTSGAAVRKIIGEAQAMSGKTIGTGKPREPMPAPSGGVYRAGRFYWYDYVEPGSAPNVGNDFSHGQHHDLAVDEWTAYLSPWFAGQLGFPWWAYVAAGAGAVASFAAISRLTDRNGRRKAA